MGVIYKRNACFHPANQKMPLFPCPFIAPIPPKDRQVGQRSTDRLRMRQFIDQRCAVFVALVFAICFCGATGCGSGDVGPVGYSFKDKPSHKECEAAQPEKDLYTGRFSDDSTTIARWQTNDQASSFSGANAFGEFVEDSFGVWGKSNEFLLDLKPYSTKWLDEQLETRLVAEIYGETEDGLGQQATAIWVTRWQVGSQRKELTLASVKILAQEQITLKAPSGSVSDAGAKAGVDLLDHSRGVLMADLDNDGDQDLAITTETCLFVSIDPTRRSQI